MKIILVAISSFLGFLIGHTYAKTRLLEKRIAKLEYVVCKAIVMPKIFGLFDMEGRK